MVVSLEDKSNVPGQLDIAYKEEAREKNVRGSIDRVVDQGNNKHDDDDNNEGREEGEEGKKKRDGDSLRIPIGVQSIKQSTTSMGKVVEKNRTNKRRKNKANGKQIDDYLKPNFGVENHHQTQENSVHHVHDHHQANEHQFYEGELLMHTYYTLPHSVQKFWNRRYELFSKYDDGVYLSEELWYSVTPELVAKYTAQLFVKLLPPDAQIGLDVCCGGGGNTIQFARYFNSVGGIDISKTNLYCTEHNCHVYGVEDNVWTLCADWAEITTPKENGDINLDWIPQDVLNRRGLTRTSSYSEPKEIFDFIFSSPPWGGTNYDKNNFNVFEMEPFNILFLLKTMKQYSENIGLFLPKSSNLIQLSTATKEVYGDFKKCRVVYINSKERTVALLALFGDVFTARFDELDDINEEALSTAFILLGNKVDRIASHLQNLESDRIITLQQEVSLLRQLVDFQNVKLEKLTCLLSEVVDNSRRQKRRRIFNRLASNVVDDEETDDASTLIEVFHDGVNVNDLERSPSQNEMSQHPLSLSHLPQQQQNHHQQQQQQHQVLIDRRRPQVAHLRQQPPPPPPQQQQQQHALHPQNELGSNLDSNMDPQLHQTRMRSPVGGGASSTPLQQQLQAQTQNSLEGSHHSPTTTATPVGTTAQLRAQQMLAQVRTPAGKSTKKTKPDQMKNAVIHDKDGGAGGCNTPEQQSPQSTNREEDEERKVKIEFINNPTSVREVYDEFFKGYNGQEPLCELDAKYGKHEWRGDSRSKESKRYQRRKRLCDVIKRSAYKLSKSDDAIINILENYRMEKSLTWIMNGHLPPELENL
ncbi:tgs1 [Candida oxycetoniae]|uniref:Trimethylguanosine synthase n=1 Tax=Candida oxycetoniae TaxID=497107 RepID=A0AAI9T0Z2_9ASCO|nr:tgs1 [Candida oxycetoniae]KAI3406329.2 tgs1 [Candida oxycetoniae]